MNKKQKITIVLGVIILLLMTLYPPYNSHRLTGQSGAFYTYGFLFDELG